MSHDDPDSDQEDGISRRSLVAAGATGWATVGLAGCNRLADPGPPNQGNGDGGGNGSGGNGDSGGNGNGNGDGGNGDGPETTVPTGNTTVTNETTTTSPTDGGETDQPTTTSGGGGCASIGRFSSGMEVGLHVEVFDDYSGDVLGDEAVEGVTVEFPDADFGPLELNWEGDHEAYSETTWGGKVVTSEDTEPGTYRYEITVENGDGESQTVVDEFTVV